MEINDVLGVKPIAEATKIVIDKSFKGLGAFLEAVFLPGLQEFGYLMKDVVRQWRLKNALTVMDKARGRLTFGNNELQLLANPRVGLSIIEESSFIDDEELQDMWAGLFASSCTQDGKDDSNIIFVDLLKRISIVEARILKYSCENSKKWIFKNGLITSQDLFVSLERLKEITGVDDIYRLDRELDHMSSLSLFASKFFWGKGGFDADDNEMKADVTPSALALNLYYKTTALNTTPDLFWKDSLEEYPDDKNKSV